MVVGVEAVGTVSKEKVLDNVGVRLKMPVGGQSSCVSCTVFGPTGPWQYDLLCHISEQKYPSQEEVPSKGLLWIQAFSDAASNYALII